jgi:hypothetical protein
MINTVYPVVCPVVSSQIMMKLSPGGKPRGAKPFCSVTGSVKSGSTQTRATMVPTLPWSDRGGDA